jgi:hypothetical protein
VYDELEGTGGEVVWATSRYCPSSCRGGGGMRKATKHISIANVPAEIHIIYSQIQVSKAGYIMNVVNGQLHITGIL